MGRSSSLPELHLDSCRELVTLFVLDLGRVNSQSFLWWTKENEICMLNISYWLESITFATLKFQNTIRLRGKTCASVHNSAHVVSSDMQRRHGKEFSTLRGWCNSLTWGPQQCWLCNMRYAIWGYVMLPSVTFHEFREINFIFWTPTRTKTRVL
jgi:hypothetical protein